MALKLLLAARAWKSLLPISCITERNGANARRHICSEKATELTISSGVFDKKRDFVALMTDHPVQFSAFFMYHDAVKLY
jgi:hypothetical protein